MIAGQDAHVEYLWLDPANVTELAMFDPEGETASDALVLHSGETNAAGPDGTEAWLSVVPLSEAAANIEYFTDPAEGELFRIDARNAREGGIVINVPPDAVDIDILGYKVLLNSVAAEGKSRAS